MAVVSTKRAYRLTVKRERDRLETEIREANIEAGGDRTWRRFGPSASTRPSSSAQVIVKLWPVVWPQPRYEEENESTEGCLNDHVTARHEERVAEVIVFRAEHPFVCAREVALVTLDALYTLSKVEKRYQRPMNVKLTAACRQYSRRLRRRLDDIVGEVIIGLGSEPSSGDWIVILGVIGGDPSDPSRRLGASE